MSEPNQGDPLVALMALQEALWQKVGEWRGKEAAVTAGALLQKITPAPWCVDDHIVREGDTPGQWHVYEMYEDDPPLLSTEFGTEADARFAAAAPQLVKELMDAYQQCAVELEQILSGCIPTGEQK